MTEDDARAWIADRFDVSRETMALLDRYVAMLLEEAQNQNLISRSTFDTVWNRHILDSAQLLDLAREAEGEWLDLGSGPGLPGVVLAILGDASITMVESRARRVDFLQKTVNELSLNNAMIVGSRLERVDPRPFGVITARAFAPLPKLLDLAEPFAKQNTLWILPKGKNVKEELAKVGSIWQGDFETVKSMSDDNAYIIRASRVRRRRGR